MADTPPARRRAVSEEAHLRRLEQRINVHRRKLEPLADEWGRELPGTQRYRELDGKVSHFQSCIGELAEEVAVTPVRTLAELVVKARIAQGQYLYDREGGVIGMDDFLMQSIVEDLIRLG